MIDKSLLDYIQSQRNNGASDEAIKRNLITNHWSEKIVHEALYGVTPKPIRTSLLSISQLISASLDLLRKKVILLALISLIPGLLIGGISLVFGFFTAFYVSSNLANLSIPLVALLVILFLIGLLIFSYVGLWMQAALLVCVSREDVGFKQSFQLSKPYVLRLYWVSLFVGLIVSGFSLLLLIPGLVAAIWFSQASFVVVDDDEKGLNALLKSREYARGHWWSIVGRFLVVGFLYFLIALIIQAVVGLLKSTALSAIVNIVFNFITGPFFLCFGYTLFNDLKTVKGKFDFSPSKKSKIIYIIISLLGIIVFAGGIAAAMLFAVDPLKQIDKARNAQRLSNLDSIRMAGERYYANYGKYPDSVETLIPIELRVIPVDSQEGVSYRIDTTGTSDFKVCAVSDKGVDLLCDPDTSNSYNYP